MAVGGTGVVVSLSVRHPKSKQYFKRKNSECCLGQVVVA